MMNIISTIILLSLITVSCNVLSTRDPESPDIGQNILVPATSPSLVLANMKLSIEGKNPNNLLDIREKLKTNRLSSSLFNSQLYTSNLEDIYTTMYEDLFKKTVIPPQSNRPQR